MTTGSTNSAGKASAETVAGWPSGTGRPPGTVRPSGGSYRRFALGAGRRRTRLPGRHRLVVGLVDRPVRLDGPQLVPAGVALDFLLGAGLEQLDQLEMLGEGLLGTMRQVDEQGRAQPAEAGCRFLRRHRAGAVGGPAPARPPP